MRDAYETRPCTDNHEETARGIDRLLTRTMEAFRVLHRIAWTAPWALTPKTCGCDE